MDGLKLDLDGLKGYMDGIKCNMNGLKEDMEGLKEGLTKLLQAMLPNVENVFHETHEENKMNYDFRDSNVGFKTHHIPNIDIRNFYGKDSITWILQMKQYFDLNNVQNTQKVCIATLQLEQNRFIWYRFFAPVKKLSLGQFLQMK